MRILMVTPYPPLRDGVAAYAVQSVARLLAEGHDVEVLSPGPSAAHHHLELRGWRGPLALARRVRAYDKVVIQYHPDLFFPQPCGRDEYLAVCLGLALVFRAAPQLEVRVHEADYRSGVGNGVLARAARAMWQSAACVVVHSAVERRSFGEAFGVADARIRLVDHGADFIPRTTGDRDAARVALGIAADERMFLSIGFLQPHKGFDRAIHAFAGLGTEGCRLDLVGSVRVEDEAYLAHRDELARLADLTPGVTLHERWVSDEEFDRWLVAADVVVLPYRHIWSSSVVERAALYGCRLVVTNVGGLARQAPPGARVVDNDAELAEAMWEAAGRHPVRQWNLASDADAATVQREVRARAAQHRLPEAGASAAFSVTEPLRRLPAPPAPVPRSGHRSVLLAKRLVGRLAGWQVEPVYRQLDSLRQATIETADRLAAGQAHDDRRG